MFVPLIEDVFPRLKFLQGGILLVEGLGKIEELSLRSQGDPNHSKEYRQGPKVYFQHLNDIT